MRKLLRHAREHGSDFLNSCLKNFLYKKKHVVVLTDDLLVLRANLCPCIIYTLLDYQERGGACRAGCICIVIESGVLDVGKNLGTYCEVIGYLIKNIIQSSKQVLGD